MSPEDAIEAMKGYRGRRVAHRVATRTRDELLGRILCAERGKIFALVGPSGVGKSAVIERVLEALVEHFRSQMISDPGFLPYVFVPAPTGFDHNFDWKDFLIRALNLMGEPLIARKTAFPQFSTDGEVTRSIGGKSKSVLRRVFESAVLHRGLKFIFVEEASAIVDEKQSKDVSLQFNLLKTLAVQQGAVLILIGAYDLLGIKEGNGQLIRRAQLIHMPRYRTGEMTLPEPGDDIDDQADSDSTSYTDDEVFADAALYLSKAAPVEIEDEVFSDWTYIFSMSVGCVGIFRDWLDRACIEALTKNEGLLTREIFEAEALPIADLITLANEAKEGEEKLKGANPGDLAKALGIHSLRSPAPVADAVTNPKRKKRKEPVGQRGPSRDVVGGQRA